MLKRKKYTSFKILLMLCWLIYTFAYIGRLNYTANILNYTINGISKGLASKVSAAFALCYGIGQLLNGILCEKYNTNKVVFFSLILAAFINLSMVWLQNFTIMIIIWGLNGIIQSTFWCNIIKLIAKYAGEKQINKSLMIMSTASPMGTFLVYGLSSFFSYLKIWKIIYIFAFLSLIIIAILFFCLFCNKKIDEVQIKKENNVKTNRISILPFVFLLIIPIFFCAVANNYIKDGTITWLPNMLNESFFLPNYLSILITLLLPMIGMISACFSIVLNNIIKNPMYTVCSMYGISIIGLLIVYFIPNIIFSIFGFLINIIGMYGVNNLLTSVLPVSLRIYAKSGRLSGIFNSFCYLGSTLSAIIPAILIEYKGYSLFIIVMIIIAIISTIISFISGFIFKRYKLSFINKEKA